MKDNSDDELQAPQTEFRLVFENHLNRKNIIYDGEIDAILNDTKIQETEKENILIILNEENKIIELKTAPDQLLDNLDRMWVFFFILFTYSF